VRLTARLAAAFLAAAALAEPAEIRARFIGNMAFQLSDGRATLRSDFPYESGYSGYMTWTDALVPPATADTLCLITHSHRDHFLAPLAARFCAKRGKSRGASARRCAHWWSRVCGASLRRRNKRRSFGPARRLSRDADCIRSSKTPVGIACVHLSMKGTEGDCR